MWILHGYPKGLHCITNKQNIDPTGTSMDTLKDPQRFANDFYLDQYNLINPSYIFKITLIMWDLSHLPLIIFFRLKAKKTWEAELLVYFNMLAKMKWTKMLCSSSKQDCLFFLWCTKIPNMYHANSKVEECKNWNYRKLGLFIQWKEIFYWKMFELKIALVCIFFSSEM